MTILINISIKQQVLTLIDNGNVIKCFKVSTSLKGIGQIKNSFQTPIGRHYIRAKIGKDQPILTIFEGRRPTGQIWSNSYLNSEPNHDWILSRILWLSGKELGFNRLGNSDTMQRYIYIHGTADEDKLGKPLSHGCIRMSNDDVIELFDLVSVGTIVHINAE